MINARTIDKIHVKVENEKVTAASMSPFAGSFEIVGEGAVSQAMNKRAVYKNGAFSIETKAQHRARIEQSKAATRAQREAQIIARWNQSAKTTQDRTAAGDAMLKNMGVSMAELMMAIGNKNTARLDEVFGYINSKLGA